jgi:hypothetical protein
MDREGMLRDTPPVLWVNGTRAQRFNVSMTAKW